MPVAMSIQWKPLRDSHYVVASLQPGGGGLRHIFVRQPILHEVQALVRRNPEQPIVGLFLGERLDCSITLAPYLLIESHVEVAVPLLDEHSVTDAIQGLRGRVGPIGRRDAPEVLGWYCSSRPADTTVSRTHEAVHRACFEESWQSVLIIGDGGNTGAFFLHDSRAARWFQAPFYELMDSNGSTATAKPTSVAWPAYITTASVVQVAELAHSVPFAPPLASAVAPVPPPIRSRQGAFPRPVVITRRTPVRDAIVGVGRAAVASRQSAFELARVLGRYATAARRHVADSIIRIRAEQSARAAQRKAEAEEERAGEQARLAREAERRAKEAAERRAAHEEAQRRAAEIEKQRAAEAAVRRAEEAEARRKAAEEEDRRRAVEAEARRKAAEEAEQRRAAEAEVRRKAAEEAEQRRAAEAEARREAAEAEAEAQRQAAAAEAEVKRQAAAAEAEARRQAAEAEARRRAEEAEARRVAEAEAAARRKTAEEAERKAAEEAQRRAAEEAQRRAAELEAQRKAAEEARRKAAEEEESKAAEEEQRRAAEAEARRQQEEVEARRQAAELEARRRAEADAEARRLAAEAEAEAQRKAVEAEESARRKAAEAEALRISVQVAALRERLARAPVEGSRREPPKVAQMADSEDTTASDGPYRFLALARREGFEVSERIERGTPDRPETVWLLHEAQSGLRLIVVTTDEEVREASLHYNQRTDDESVLQSAEPEHRDLGSRTIYRREECLDRLRARCRRLRASGTLVRDWKAVPTFQDSVSTR